MNEKYYKGCAGKERFSSYGEADAQLKKWSRGKKKRSINAYRCEFCHGYHVGHKKKRKMKNVF